MAPRTRSQTGSLPKKKDLPGYPNPTRGTTTRVGRKAVTKPRKPQENNMQNVEEALLREYLSPLQQTASNPLPSVGFLKHALEIPPVADSPPGQLRIFYGEDAPYPRWKTILDERPHGDDLEKDLIRTHPGRTHVPGLAPGSHPRANDYTIGLGSIKWNFEPGPATGWGGLTGQELYFEACTRLKAALDDPWSRWQLQDAIRKGEDACHVANVEDPVPPLIRFGGSGLVPLNDPLIVRIKENSRKMDKFINNRPQFLDMQQFERPSLAWRPRGTQPDLGEYSQFVDISRNRQLGTLGPPGHQDPSFDPTAKPNSQPSAVWTPAEGARAAQNATDWVFHRAQRAAGTGDVATTATSVVTPGTLSEKKAATSKTQSTTKESERLMRDAKRYIRNEQDTKGTLAQVIFPVHKAAGAQQGRGKAAKKSPVPEPAPDSNQAAERFAVLDGVANQHPMKLHLPPNDMDESAKYFRMCNDIVDDPEARQKYYPKVDAFRRIRSWAGAVMPANVERNVKANISRVPSSKRPFTNMKGPRRAST